MPSFPPVTNRALAILLAGAHHTGTELAALAGLKPGTISAYISGRAKTLSMENLFRFAALLGVEPPGVLDALLLASRLGPGAAPGRPALVAKLGRLTEELVEARLPKLLEEGEAHEERRRARELWSALSDRPAEDWRSVLTELPRLVSWAVCELVSEKSADAASDDADRALELAELALWTAGRVPDEARRRECEAYARGFLGNARRVRSQLRVADEEIDLALRLWQECQKKAADHPCLLDGTRLLDLKASLRIDQRRLTEARALLAEAAAHAASGLPLGRILIIDSYALELLGDYRGAVETLRRSALLTPETEVRLRWVVQFNQMVNLCHLSEAAEAGRMLPGLRTLAAQIGYSLDGMRLRWLERSTIRICASRRKYEGCQSELLPDSPGSNRWWLQASARATAVGIGVTPSIHSGATAVGIEVAPRVHGGANAAGIIVAPRVQKLYPQAQELLRQARRTGGPLRGKMSLPARRRRGNPGYGEGRGVRTGPWSWPIWRSGWPSGCAYPRRIKTRSEA